MALAAGAARRNAEAPVLQGVDKTLRAQSGYGQIDDMGRLLSAEQGHAVQGRKPLLQQRFQPVLFGNVRHAPGHLGCTGGGKARDHGQIFRAAAKAALLTAAVDQGRQVVCQVECAHALACVNLVARHGDQVRAQGGGAEGHLEEALDGVGVEQGVGTQAVGEPRHFFNGHHRAGFVVDHHDADQDGVRPQNPLQVLRRDAAQGIGLQVGHVEAPLLQLFHGMEHRVMLHGGGDNVLAPLAEALNGGENGPVVRFGAAGGEKDPVRRRTHGLSHLLPAAAQEPRRLHAQVVLGAGVAPVLRQGFCNGLHGLLAGLCGGGVVQVDHRFPPGVCRVNSEG